FGGLGRRGFGVRGGFIGRIRVIRRGFQRWGFDIGVQWSVLDLFRIQDVCHNCQLRDSWVGGPVKPPCNVRRKATRNAAPSERLHFPRRHSLDSEPACEDSGIGALSLPGLRGFSKRRPGVWPVEWPGTTVSMG